MATKNGIEYDLTRTPYVVYWRRFGFYFSSATHLEKFEKKIQIRIDWLNDSMSRRFHVECEFDELAVLQLYMQVETRGFLIVNQVNGEVHQCPENIILAGMRINEKPSIPPSDDTIRY